MNNGTKTTTGLCKLGCRITDTYARRLCAAQHTFRSSIEAAVDTVAAAPVGEWANAWQPWIEYSTDCFERGVLFWDTLRQRGNNFLEHERAGKPPLLAYEYATIVDGRELDRPVNYALIKIKPPTGIEIDEQKRPFIIVDPRAGHGPGIGGFKQDSQVGVALKAGHPVYFVIFFARPEPGQTLPDVCEAEALFVQAVADRHPDSPKPVLMGNCQGGWATMLLAAAHPDVTGPVVINGAPMSYWSGSWQGGEGENPMRYLGGLMGGSWVALLTSDLGNGLVDGAHFVANFERLNPANTFWSKYYHLWANVDTEPPRFLGFERWWGGYFFMNEEELEWIVDNLFVGNRLARGEAQAAPRSFFDLKAIRSPIIVFSSSGDNITPPQQALNWIADAYESTEEIKANGQVIVGLLHEDVGHLGIFVSGRVARKEHAQIVEVLEHIEALRPGLYLMEIHEAKDAHGKSKYDVTIEERRLEDLRRLNKLERRDEKPFEVVAEVSALTEKAYTTWVRPFVRPLVNEQTAELARIVHPLRLQRWALSDLSPWLRPLPTLASSVKANRHAAPPSNPYRQLEQATADMMTAGLNLYRDLRDATMEALFFQVYGTAAVLRSAAESTMPAATGAADSRALPKVREALAAIGQGAYPEAVALVGALLGRAGGSIPLHRLELVERLIRGDEVLSRLPADEVRRIRAAQAVVAELEPERGLQSLPDLLPHLEDRQRLLELLSEAVAEVEPTPKQQAVIDQVRNVLNVNPPRPQLAAFDETRSEATGVA